MVSGTDLVADEVTRVRELLANAPADRASRHHVSLVLCRAHFNRLCVSDNIAGGGDWDVVLAKLLAMEDEFMFRTIVRYL